MTGATLYANHAAQRPLKTRLFADVLAEIRATRGFKWCIELHDESAIVGQVDARAIAVALYLPHRFPSMREIRARDGENRDLLAVEFGVSRSMIDGLMRGLFWREPPGPLALIAQQAGML